MKRVALVLAVVATMAYGAFLSFNWDSQPVASSSGNDLTVSQTPEAKAEVGSTISAIILPLESSSGTERTTILRELATKTSPKRIVLAISDESTGDEVKVYPESWNIGEEQAVCDAEVLKSLKSENYAVENTKAFLDHKDIQPLISELYTVFDKSVYNTLLVPAGVSQTRIQDLAQFLYSGDAEALVIAAGDFSAGLPDSLANIHDQNAYQVLASQKMDSIWQSDISSPGAVLLASEYAKSSEKTSFHAVGKNQVVAYWDGNAGETLAKSSSFIIAGDAMFDRNVWHNFKDVGLDKIFANLPDNLFKGTDLSMLNHEGPISATAINDDYQSGSMVFNFPPVVPQVLKNLGIKAVSLANNHSFNALVSGFANTQKVLSAADIANFGRQTGFDAKEDIIHQDGAIPLSIIGIDTLAKYDEKAFIAAIKKEKADGYFVIIFPHWGEEYKTVHNASQTTMANKWIDAGAGMIVGSHPHVVQDFEVIKGVPVVYSLGNFVFDQFFSDDTQHGLIVAGTVSEKQISLSFLPTKEVVVKPQLLKGAEKTSSIAKVLDINTPKGFIKISDDTIEISRN